MLGKHIAVIALGALLAGCATAAQRQYQAMATGNQAIVAQLKACGAEVYGAPEAASIRHHFPLDARDITLAQLSDESLATRPEIDAILKLHPRLQACRKVALDALLNTTPAVVPILAKEAAEGDNDTLALIQRKISWGERVRRGRDRALAAQAALQAEGQRITAGLEQSHQAELSRRQAALNALAQWAQTQQAIEAINRPVVTNCTGSPNSINCITR